MLLADARLDIINYEFKVTFPTSSSTNKAGLVFAHDGNNSYYAVVLNRNTGKLALYKITSGSWGSVLASGPASGSATINDSTQYTVKVVRRQSHVEAWLVGQSTVKFSYSSSTDLGVGKSGLYSDKTNVTFDDFQAARGEARDAKTPRIGGVADAALSSSTLLVTGGTRGGEAVVENFSGGAYTVQVDYDLNGGNEAYVWIHYVDANNGYRVYFDVQEIWLDRVKNGEVTRLYTSAVGGSGAQTVAVRYETSGPRVRVFAGGTEQFNVVDANLPSGGVALGGAGPKFDNLKIGYDNNSDGDLNDAGDDLVMSESFGSTSKTVSHDHAVDLIDDGTNQFIYDAWNRLVKVRSAQTTTLTIQTAEFDGSGRRIKKVVTNSGSFDATWIYFYDGQKIIETRDGSGNMMQQFVHGKRYIDELTQMRVKDKGDLYVHQDANWNVTALTDLGGSVVERYVYTPYGELTVHQDTSYGDRDGDQDVDSTDKGTVGTTCTGTVTGACRILDLDFDGDYDSTDATKLDALPQGIARHPGKSSTAVDQPFAYQGLLYEPEIGSYQNRERQLDPTKRRFLQRDPTGYSDGMTAYGYLRCNPGRRNDPSGMSVLDVDFTDPTQIRVRAKVAFWGCGAVGFCDCGQKVCEPQVIQTGLLQELNDWANTMFSVYNTESSGGRTVVFVFTDSDVITNVLDGTTDCDQIPDHEYMNDRFGGACAQAALDRAPGFDIAVWVKNTTCTGSKCSQGGGEADLTGGQRAWVWTEWAKDPDLHLIGHELGHLFAPAIGHACNGGIMCDAGWQGNRNLPNCFEVVSSVNAHQAPSIPPWSCASNSPPVWVGSGPTPPRGQVHQQ